MGIPPDVAERLKRYLDDVSIRLGLTFADKDKKLGLVAKRAERDAEKFIEETEAMGLDMTKVFANSGLVPSVVDSKEYIEKATYIDSRGANLGQIAAFMGNLENKGFDVGKLAEKLEIDGQTIKSNDHEGFIERLQDKFREDPSYVINLLNQGAKTRWRETVENTISANVVDPALLVAYSSEIIPLRQVVNNEPLSNAQKEKLKKNIYELCEKQQLFSLRTIMPGEEVLLSVLPIRTRIETDGIFDREIEVPEKKLRLSIETPFLPTDIGKEIEKYYDINRYAMIWSGLFNYSVQKTSDGLSFETVLPHFMVKERKVEIVKDLQQVAKRAMGYHSLFDELSGSEGFSEKEDFLKPAEPSLSHELLERGIVGNKKDIEAYLKDLGTTVITPTVYRKTDNFLLGEKAVFKPPIIAVNASIKPIEKNLQHNYKFYLTALPSVSRMLQEMKEKKNTTDYLGDINLDNKTVNIDYSPRQSAINVGVYSFSENEITHSIVKSSNVVDGVVKTLLVRELFKRPK